MANNPFHVIIVWGNVSADILSMIKKLVLHDVRVILYSTNTLTKRGRKTVQELSKDHRFSNLKLSVNSLNYQLITSDIESVLSNEFELNTNYKVSGFIFTDELSNEVLLSVPEDIENIIDIFTSTDLSIKLIVEKVVYQMYEDKLALKLSDDSELSVKSANFINASLLEWLYNNNKLCNNTINLHSINGHSFPLLAL